MTKKKKYNYQNIIHTTVKKCGICYKKFRSEAYLDRLLRLIKTKYFILM